MLKKIIDKNCIISIFNNLVFKSFKTRRIFFLLPKKDCLRGGHAHKKCTQIFFSIKGNFKIKIFNGKKVKEKIITPTTKGLVVRPMNWVDLELKRGNVCMVLCDRKFEENDYIRNIEKFKKN
jgi:hypothetical protein